MHQFTQGLTIMGTVQCPINIEQASFVILCDSGDTFIVYITSQTSFQVLRNLDNLDNDRVQNPQGFNSSSPSASQLVEKYIAPGQLVTAYGVYQINDNNVRFDARTVYLTSSVKGQYLFEETHWWLTQTARLADQWLDSLFGDKRDYEIDDFVKLYHTNLNILGLPTDDNIQECAVLSRLIYGFSAAYLLTGDERYRKAAAAGVLFQRDAFRSLSHNGQYCFWAYGRVKGLYGTELLVPSKSGDDTNSIPLYEQIYALAGLTLYYRISLDWEVLEDIRRTIKAFNDFYLDEFRENDSAFKGYDGYFSHIDYATMRPDKNLNPANNLKKNWNSIGDHIPAYLINLLLALDPIPQGRQDLNELQSICQDMFLKITTLILEKFPDPNPDIPYVNERFCADWTPDHSYSWQQNRAIIGHNFKIAWNLTRIANRYSSLAMHCKEEQKETSSTRSKELTQECLMLVDRLEDRQGISSLKVKKDACNDEAKLYENLAQRCWDLADKLGKSMTKFGIDHIRGGCFDAVERQPSNGQPVEFTWMNTKDFWQQEQAILAYLILHGKFGPENPKYLEFARRMEAFWNTFFLDRDHHGMFFRVSDNGLPIEDNTYGVRGGHADASGYHCFELNFLAHIYTRIYVAPSLGKQSDTSFCLYFRPNQNCGMKSINVLPDFFPPDSLAIKRIVVNGVPRPNFNPKCFQIELSSDELGSSIVVEFEASGMPLNPRLTEPLIDTPLSNPSMPCSPGGLPPDQNSKPLAGKKIGVLIESLYIPEEISAYRKDFQDLGAEVHLMSRLWGNKTLKFVSDPNGLDACGNPKQAETIDVSIDFENICLEDYAAIIMSANYTSVRLRFFQPPEQPKDAKAVQFFAKAMMNPNIVKGALCHGLWILTPRPGLLQGRRVTCHEVVRADVLNAGAIFTPTDTSVVVDGDLVTGHSKDEVHRFIQEIGKQIQKLNLIHPH